MPEALYLELIRYGGGIAIIIVLIFFIRELTKLIYHKNGKEMKEIQHKMNNDFPHEFAEINKRIGRLEDKMELLGERVVKLEVKSQ